MTQTPSNLLPANDVRLLVPQNLRIDGLIETTADLEIHGRVDGEIRAALVVIAKSANVSALVVADKVVIAGAMTNSEIYAGHIVLEAGCDVECDLYYRDLDIGAGALFEGRTRRHLDPASLAPPPDEGGAEA